MNHQINHEVFGEIVFEAGWVKEINLEMFGVMRKLEVVIDAEEDGEFEEVQIEAYKKFFRYIDQRVKDAERAVLNYYESEIPSYREKFKEEERHKYVPKITGKDDLSALVTPKKIMFPMVFDDNEREAGFICDCSWEIEHGLGVRFVNEEVVEVGFQDILL